MIQICKFNSQRDVERTISGLSVDLQQAIESGVVLDTGVVEDFNNINSPDSVHTRVRDVFHAMDLKRAYLEAGKINPTTSLSGSNESGNISVTNSGSVDSSSSSGSATAGE